MRMSQSLYVRTAKTCDGAELDEVLSKSLDVFRGLSGPMLTVLVTVGFS